MPKSSQCSPAALVPALVALLAPTGIRAAQAPPTPQGPTQGPSQGPSQGPALLDARAPSKPGEPVRFSLKAAAGLQWAMVFYRALGEDEFCSLPLRSKGEGGEWAAELPSDEIGGRAIQYYLAFKGTQGVAYLPEDAPTAISNLELSTEVSAATPGKTSSIRQKVPFHLDASLEQVIYRSDKLDTERTFSANGQVGLGYEVEAGEHHLAFSTRVAYQNQVADGQPHWNVGELHGIWAFRDHQAQIGDMALQESEFTVGGSGRRGMDYKYDDHTFYAHLFAVGTEQLGEFKGLIWPEKGTELFGGALGYLFHEGQVKTKFVFLTGRDDPAQGVNVGFSNLMTRREGSTGAMTMEADLLQHRLNLNGEYARSSYDKDLDDTTGKVNDQAWRLGCAWNDTSYSARASYRQVGRDFGTLGYATTEGDRRAMDGGFTVSLSPSWAINASAVSERNNPDGNPLETKATSDTQNMETQWMARPGFTVKAGLSHAKQTSAESDGYQVLFANSQHSGIFTGFDWAMNPNSALTFNVQFDRIEGTGAYASTGRSTTAILGGSFLVPERFRIAPTVSYSCSKEDGTGADSKVASLFLNSEITLIQKRLILALNGGYNRTESGGMDAITSTNADAALQYHLSSFLDQAFHRGQAILALRFRYTQSQLLPEADRRASLTLNFSF